MSVRVLGICLAVLTLLVPAGCGGKRPKQPGTGPGTGPGTTGAASSGGANTIPLLLGVEPDPLLVAPGDVIKIVGINLNNDLSKNVVNFISGAQRIPGIPIRVDFPSDGNPSNGQESELLVVVPGGISTGNVELRVNGADAGSRGFDARPQIMAWTLGQNETQELLEYNSLLGFNQQASFVKLFGLNFNEIEEVQLEDSQGGSARISPNAIQRNPAPPPGSQTGGDPTGYSVIGFNLKDSRNDVRLNFTAERRENMKIRIKSPAGISNTVEVPVHSNVGVGRIGAVINGIKSPTGVRTGPVRIFYNMYDRIGPNSQSIGVDINYRMEVFWKLPTEEDAQARPAKPATNDPLQSGINNLGVTGLLPGSIFMRSQNRLFQGGGSLRVFTWDAPNDPTFRTYMNTLVDGKLKDRFVAIQLLFKPSLEANVAPPQKNLNPNHTVQTPTFLYYYLEDRANDIVADERAGSFLEKFTTDTNEDTRLTTALYGPPSNPGALSGGTSGTSTQFGSGDLALKLLNTAPEDLFADAVDQYYLINTDDLTVVFRQIANDNGTPCNPDDDELAGGGRGQRDDTPAENPGKAIGELHLSTLEIGQGVKVFARGTRPLVIRLSGTLDSADEEVFVAKANSRIDLNGCLGEDGPRPGSTLDTAGNGGRGGPGGGDGGLGASTTDGAGGFILLAAEAGGFDGGGGGETTLAVDGSVDPAKGSKVPGGPGGGGGNRTPGIAGDSGVPAPPRYAPPRPGSGGHARGEARQILLSPGSGGGGGGGTYGTLNGSAAFNAGAGGGGGGGAMRLVVNGKAIFDPSSVVEANGGKGGTAVVPNLNPRVDGSAAPAPGGGGSGGAIVIQARGSVQVACENLVAHGGIGGASPVKQNVLPGAGSGGEGWIRVESAAGGVPTCAAFAAQTRLAEAAAATVRNTLKVDTTDGFPSAGTILVLKADTGDLIEEISYLATTPTSFDNLFRGATPQALPQGATVVLRGPVAPISSPVLAENKIVKSPDVVDTGRARDGELHVRFEPSRDSVTGDPVVDPVTGEQLSIWTFNTDTGALTRPSGVVAFEVAASDTDPGRIEVSRFLLDARTILRCSGSRPVRLYVSGQADIGGTIDVSGFDGGALRFSESNRRDPEPGLGGLGGPGGGNGGDGGVTRFLNGNLDDKVPENTLPLHGGAGRAPANTPDGWDQTDLLGSEDLDDELTPPGSFLRAGGGVTIRGRNCGGVGQPICVNTSGGGGGGGNLEKGKDGSAFPDPADIFGPGASIFGLENFRFGGDYLLVGGLGGGGGGGNPHVSASYLEGYDGVFRFKKDAAHAPGTGGGGGGGALLLAAQNLSLRPTARILARGGNGLQSIDLGGNGGGGAGGSILIQVKNSLTIEAGALIDVSGGKANQVVPILVGQTLEEYPGNVHVKGSVTDIAGGAGGDGSPGRVRIEADSASIAALSGVNANYSGGPFLLDTVLTLGVSRAIRIGVGPGLVASSHTIELEEALVRFFDFGQPNGTDAVVTWQGSRESLDVHGGVTPFSSQTGQRALLGLSSAAQLEDHDFVRFVVPFLSNATTRDAQSIREIELPFFLPSSN